MENPRRLTWPHEIRRFHAGSQSHEPAGVALKSGQRTLRYGPRLHFRLRHLLLLEDEKLIGDMSGKSMQSM